MLTDYDELKEIVPFLKESRPLAYQSSKRLKIYQKASFSNSFWSLEGEGILDVEERQLPLGLKEIRFKMVEGDFEVWGNHSLVNQRSLLKQNRQPQLLKLEKLIFVNAVVHYLFCGCQHIVLLTFIDFARTEFCAVLAFVLSSLTWLLIT